MKKSKVKRKLKARIKGYEETLKRQTERGKSAFRKPGSLSGRK